MTKAKTSKLGLREKQRQERHEKIISCAEELFSQNGYENTSLEQVAESANLSPQTIYNYFSSKRELLQSIRVRDEEQVRLRVDAAFPKILETNEVGEALLDLLMLPILTGYDFSNKRVWREIISEIMKSGPGARTKYASGLDYRTQKILSLLEHYRDSGAIVADGDCLTMAEVLQSIVRNEFRNYVLNDALTTEDLKARLWKQIQFLLKGVRS